MFQGYVYSDFEYCSSCETESSALSAASVSRTSEDDVLIKGQLGDTNVVTRGKCPSPTFEKASYEDLTPDYYKNRDYVLTSQKVVGENICQYTYYLTTTTDDRYHPDYFKHPR